VLARDGRPEVPVCPGGRLEQHTPDLVHALGGGLGEPRPHRGGVDDAGAVAGRGDSLVCDDRRLYYALPTSRQVLASLQGFRFVLSDKPAVVLAELSAVHGDRATLLATVQESGTARVFGHDSNCC
jgi:hypothetical protein